MAVSASRNEAGELFDKRSQGSLCPVPEARKRICSRQKRVRLLIGAAELRTLVLPPFVALRH